MRTSGLSEWGYRFDELGDALAEVIKASTAADEKVTLVIHDWGSHYGFHLAARHPELVARIVALDVGPPVPLGLKAIPVSLVAGFAYQCKWCVLQPAAASRKMID